MSLKETVASRNGRIEELTRELEKETEEKRNETEAKTQVEGELEHEREKNHELDSRLSALVISKKEVDDLCAKEMQYPQEKQRKSKTKKSSTKGNSFHRYSLTGIEYTWKGF